MHQIGTLSSVHITLCPHVLIVIPIHTGWMLTMARERHMCHTEIEGYDPRVGSWKLTSRFTSMQNLDRIYTITSGSHPCRNGWTFHIWSHIHAESGSDWCHICKIHVKFSARAARALAMHVRNHMQNHIWEKFAGENHIQGHIHAEFEGKSSHLKFTSESHPKSHPCKIHSLPAATPMPCPQ